MGLFFNGLLFLVQGSLHSSKFILISIVFPSLLCVCVCFKVLHLKSLPLVGCISKNNEIINNYFLVIMLYIIIYIFFLNNVTVVMLCMVCDCVVKVRLDK